MQKIVADHRRAANEKDPAGVADADATLRTAYDVLERQLSARTWAIGNDFSIADAAASPALFYSGFVVPFAETHPHVAKYFERLVSATPSSVSFARHNRISSTTRSVSGFPRGSCSVATRHSISTTLG